MYIGPNHIPVGTLRALDQEINLEPNSYVHVFFLRCISASSPIVTGYPPSRFMFDWRSQFFERKFPVSSGGATSTWAAERSDDQSNAEAFSVAETIDLGNAEFGISWYHMISESEGGALFKIKHTHLFFSVALICMYTNLMTFRCIVLMNYMFLSYAAPCSTGNIPTP